MSKLPIQINVNFCFTQFWYGQLKIHSVIIVKIFEAMNPLLIIIHILIKLKCVFFSSPEEFPWSTDNQNTLQLMNLAGLTTFDFSLNCYLIDLSKISTTYQNFGGD